ncbi:MAG: thioredoxin-disulfide reductase [Candidatus Altiarchaeota archaeon]
MDYDFIIVGGGPAGLTAGIYAVRRNLKTLIVEKALPGGQMQLTPIIENWPGEKQISGAELSAKMHEQAKSLGVQFLFGEAEKLELESEEKKIHVSGKVLTCKAALLCRGGEHKHLGVPGETELLGRGVSYCATCDAPFFKGKTVAVVGGGNTAVSDALYLSETCSRVYIIHRRDQFRAEEKQIEEMTSKGIVPILNSEVEKINGEKFVSSITIKDVRSKKTKDLKAEGVFISIGIKPNSELAKDAGVKVDGDGFIMVDRKMQTNIPGVFAAGDVIGGVLQVATAVGEGCTAALSAYEYIRDPYWSRK